MKTKANILASTLLASAQWLKLSTAQEYTFTDEQKRNANRDLSIGYVVYHGFQMLDVFGPLDFLSGLSYTYNMTLSIIANATGPVHSRPPSHHAADGSMMDLSRMLDAQLIATHTFETAPPLDVLIVTGGLGNRIIIEQNNRHVEDFIVSRFNTTDYVLSVCTGAALLARAGVLDGRRATTNKAAFDTRLGKNVTWVPSARWVQDGKVWTSSGVSAGMDMMTAFLRHIYGDPKVNNAINIAEYAPHLDPTWDPFSVVHKVPGANTNRSLTDCVSPLEGYPEGIDGKMERRMHSADMKMGDYTGW